MVVTGSERTWLQKNTLAPIGIVILQTAYVIFRTLAVMFCSRLPPSFKTRHIVKVT